MGLERGPRPWRSIEEHSKLLVSSIFQQSERHDSLQGISQSRRWVIAVQQLGTQSEGRPLPAQLVSLWKDKGPWETLLPSVDASGHQRGMENKLQRLDQCNQSVASSEMLPELRCSLGKRVRQKSKQENLKLKWLGNHWLWLVFPRSSPGEICYRQADEGNSFWEKILSDFFTPAFDWKPSLCFKHMNILIKT